MKRKVICVVLSLTMVVAAFFGMTGEYLAMDGEVSEVVSAVTEYMDYREEILVTGTAPTESKVVIGITNDELEHYAVLEEQGIEICSSTIRVTDVDIYDTMIFVEFEETSTYTKESVLSIESIEHLATIMTNNAGELVVVSDKYLEECSGFVSCSYVVEEYGVSPAAVGTVGLPLILQIAQGEEGYVEKASNSELYSKTGNAVADDHNSNCGDNCVSCNYTKYGEWYGVGWNPNPWCAMFVSWCANQAGLSESVVPKYASCDVGMQWFRNQGRFHDGVHYGGTYTPRVGDIFFTGDTASDSDHTGFVIAVGTSTFTVVDGNCNNQVRVHEYSITDSSIIGFGTPAYVDCNHDVEYTGNSTGHWMECTECNTKFSGTAIHLYINGRCSICGYYQAIIGP